MAKIKNIKVGDIHREMKENENLYIQVLGIYEPMSDFLFSMNRLAERDLKDYFIDGDELDKLREALEIIERIKDDSYRYAQKKAIELLKAS